MSTPTNCPWTNSWFHCPRGRIPSLRSAAIAAWGSRRYQRKIFGKGDSDKITVGSHERLCLKKQHLMLYVIHMLRGMSPYWTANPVVSHRVLDHCNHLITRQLWLTVNLPAFTPGTPRWTKRIPIATLPVWAFREKRPFLPVNSFSFFWFFHIPSV